MSSKLNPQNVLFILVILFISFNCTAQRQAKVDSLQKELQEYAFKKKKMGTRFKPIMDSVKVILYFKLHKEYYENSNSVTDTLAKACLKISENIGYKKGLGIGYSLMGLINAPQDVQLEYHTKALKIRREIKDYWGISRSLNNIGLIHIAKGDYENAHKIFDEALEISLKWKFSDLVAVSYHNKGMCYNNQGIFSKSIELFFKAAAINERSNAKPLNLAKNYAQIALACISAQKYTDAIDYAEKAIDICRRNGYKDMEANVLLNGLSSAYASIQDYPKAIDAYHKAINLYKEMNHTVAVNMLYVNMGDSYCFMGNYSEALKYTELAHNYFLKTQNEYGLSLTNCNLGMIYLRLGNYEKALHYETISLDMAKKLNNVDVLRYSYEFMAEINAGLGKYKKAYHYYKLYKVYYDSLFNNSKSEEILRQQMNYNFEKKEIAAKAAQDKKDALAIKEIEKQKLLRNSFLGAFTTVGLFAFVFFRQRNKIKKGKKRSDELLLNILPAEIAEELKENGKTKARNIDVASILFTDFKEFTQLSSNMSGEELVSEINTCFEEFDRIIDKYNIEKIKTIGDAYMAAGGLPVPTDASVKNTVLAALEMQQFISERKTKNDAQGKPAFEMRVGIHTGPVVAGIVGVKKFQYDIWGDTVNTASRIENHGEEGKVNISQSTYELIKNDPLFAFENRGKIAAKGKGEIEMWFVKLA